MKNQVIKNLNRSTGQQILKYFKGKGFDTDGYLANCCEEDGDSCIYYGVINDEFHNFTIEQVYYENAEIIELPYTPEVGLKEFLLATANEMLTKANELITKANEIKEHANKL